MVKAALFQIRHRFRRVQQCVVVELHHTGEQLLTARFIFREDFRLIFGNQRHHGGIVAQLRFQTFHRLTQAEFFRLHHPVQHRSARITAEAVIQVFLRRDHTGRRFLVMERTQRGEVLPFFNQLSPLRLNHGDQGDGGFQVLQLCFRDAGHNGNSCKNLSIGFV